MIRSSDCAHEWLLGNLKGGEGACSFGWLAPGGSFHEGHCSDTNRADATGSREHEVKRLQPNSLASAV